MVFPLWFWHETCWMLPWWLVECWSIPSRYCFHCEVSHHGTSVTVHCRMTVQNVVSMQCRMGLLLMSSVQLRFSLCSGITRKCWFLVYAPFIGLLFPSSADAALCLTPLAQSSKVWQLPALLLLLLWCF